MNPFVEDPQGSIPRTMFAVKMSEGQSASPMHGENPYGAIDLNCRKDLPDNI